MPVDTVCHPAYDASNTKGITMNAIVYTRVSTNDQAESGAGLAAQSASCAAYAAKADMNVIGTFTDAAISGLANKRSMGIS